MKIRRDMSASVNDHGAAMAPDAIEFALAMEEWQRRNGRTATYADALAVAKQLGYEREDLSADDCATVPAV